MSQLSRYTQPQSHALTPRTAWLKESRSTLLVSCPQNSYTSSRNVICYTSLDYTRARALLPYLRYYLPHMSYIHLSANTNPADIYGHICVALWLSPNPSQVVSPSSSLEIRLTGMSPKTSSLLNTRIYVSNPCPSTNRSQRRSTILRKASRHRPGTGLGR